MTGWRRWLDRISIPQRVLGSVLLAILVTCVGAFGFLAPLVVDRSRDELRQTLDSDLDALVMVVGVALEAQREETLETVLEQFAARPDVLRVALRSASTNIELRGRGVSANTAPAWFGELFAIGEIAASRSLVESGERDASVYVALDPRRSLELAWRIVVWSLALAGAGLAFACACFAAIVGDGMRFLRILVDGGREFAGGNYANRIAPAGSPEFRALIGGYNAAASDFERLIDEARVREAHLSATLYSVGDGVLVTDARGRITLMNPVAESLTGWSESEARGRPVGEVFCIINQQTRESLSSPVDIVLREGRVVGLANHTLLLARDGVERPVADSGAPIQVSGAGRIDGVVLVFRDQSEDYRTQEALRQSAELYSSLVASVPVGIIHLDTQGDVVFFSEVAAELFEMPAGVFDRERWLGRVHPADIGDFVSGLRQALRDQSRFSVTLRISPPTRGPSWVDMRVAPLRDARGRVAGFVGSVLDITAERNARQRIEDLSALYAALSGVNTAIVHCTDERDLHAGVCRAAVEQGGFAMAWLGRVDWRADRIELLAHAGENQTEVASTVAAIRISEAGESFQSLTSSAVRSGKTQMSMDIRNDLRFGVRWRKLSGSLGGGSCAAIPIRLFGKIAVILFLGSSRPGFFTREVLALADEIGNDLTYALENLERDRQHQLAVDKMELSEERLRLTLSSIDVGMKEVNLRTRRVWLNATSAKILGLGESETELDMDDYLTLSFPGVDREEIRQLGDRVVSGQQTSYSYERPFTRPDGELRWLRSRGGPVTRLSRYGDDPIAFSVIIDVTEQHEQAERERLAMVLFANSLEAASIADGDGNLLMVNQAFCDQTGYSADEVLGTNLRLLKSGCHDAVFYGQMWQALESDGAWQGEIWNRRKNGEIYPAQLCISAVRNGDGRITHYVAQSSDVSQRKSFEQRITYLAYRDSLTDLPNRALFRDRVEQAMAAAQREGNTLALLFMDLDHFKNINDSLGHSVGDCLLCEIAQRLSAEVRDMDTVGRLGGDEFLLVLPGADVESAGYVARKLLDRVAEVFDFEGHLLTVTPSIGIAIFPRDGDSYEELLKSADTAMYKAKEEGRNNYRFFTREMNAVVFRRLMLESSLRRAVEAGEFMLYYQPQYDFATRSLVGAEALIRWNEATMGFVPPDQFIPVAEESGMIELIGDWVLNEACRQVRAWLDAGYAPVRVAINMSARQFAARAVLDHIDATLARHRLPGDALEVEITERLIADDLKHTFHVLKTLREWGVHVAVDDFGTGYSSLSYLKRFPIDRLKIDQSFVRDLENDPDDRAIATAVVTLGHSLDMKVIAEGVEHAAHFEILRAMGCDEVQGYHLGRPMPAADFAVLLPRAG